MTLLAIRIASAEYVSPNFVLEPQNRSWCVGNDTQAIKCLLSEFSSKYDLKSDILDKVAFCESSYNPLAVGDGGHAKNVMQFHKPTFEQFSKEFGEELNYDSAYDQIKLSAWMFSKGENYRNHWTCYKKIK